MQFQITPFAVPDVYGEALLPLADAKAWCRVLHDDDDDLIAALRDAAIDMVEQYANLRMGPCTGMTATFAGFGPAMRIGIGPAATLSITGIDYVDGVGAPQVLGAGAWYLSGGALYPHRDTQWPALARDAVVTFDVGYPTGACPAALIMAAKMFVAHLYVHREAVITGTISEEIPLGFMALCSRYRMPVL